jgi:hypothetical protein
MRNLLTYLILFFIFSLNTIAQTYQPFPTANAMWRENSGGFQCSCCADFQYTITGDTVINTITYHKIQKTGVKYQEDMIGNCTSNIQYIINQYAGSYRNDIINKKIFFIYPFSSTDTLLYDFNLSIGDTVHPSPLNDNGNFINIVTDIDSVYLGGVYRKRFKIDSCMMQQLYYIEGIGSTYGLLSPTICPFEAIYNLLCFTNNNQPVYPDSSTICSIVTSVNQNNVEDSYNIFPNPVTDILNITIAQNDDPTVTITIFNMIGEITFQTKLKTNHVTINTEEFPTGIYLVQIHSDKNTFTKKIIKQ